MNDQPSIITRLHILNEESFYIDYMCNYVLSFSEQIKNHLFFDTRFYTRFYDENTCKINKKFFEFMYHINYKILFKSINVNNMSIYTDYGTSEVNEESFDLKITEDDFINQYSQCYINVFIFTIGRNNMAKFKMLFI